MDNLLYWFITQKPTGKLLAGAMAMVFICCCSLLGFSALDATARQVGLLPTYTPKPTSTPTSTDTPIPTQTYTPIPTDTLVPTHTPLPTDTQTPPPANTAVPPAGTSPSSHAPAATTYTVQPGETLNEIAKRYNITSEELAAANNIADPSRIQVGQILVIPSSETASPQVETPPPPLPAQPAEVPPNIQMYALTIAQKMQTMADALQAIGDLTLAPDALSDDWKLQVALQLAIIQVTHQELEDMDVPPEMQEVHAAVLEATADCALSTDYLASGIDNFSTDDIEAGASLMESCGEKMQKPLEMVNDYANR
jgi:LysM repeat protein